MENKYIQTLLTSLYEAIYDNNYTQTQEIVNELNTIIITQKQKEFLQVNNPFSFIDMSMMLKNKSYEYTLFHLQNIYNIEFFQWSYLVTNLIVDKNKTKINKIIKQFLNNDTYFNQFINTIGFNQVQLDLIKLCYVIQDFQYLIQIQEKENWILNRED